MAIAKKSKKVEAGLVLNTAMLKEMVGKSFKGAGMNRLLPITQMMCIRLKDNVLELITTDSTNYFYVRQDKIEGSEFYAVVGAEQFSKLISKMTCDSVTLTRIDSAIEVKGNGKYMVPLQYDEDGLVVSFPDPLKDFKAEGESIEIMGSTVDVILNAVKPSLATTLETPCYTGYYVGDRVVGTDQMVISVLDASLFNEAILVSPEVMDLIGLMDSEHIDVDFQDDITVFSNPKYVVYSHNMEGIEDFEVDAIVSYTEMDFPSMCKLPKNSLLQLLDRLSLFVSDFDNGGIELTFTKEGLQVSSLTSNGVDLIPYIESEDFNDFTCKMDLSTLLKQLKTQVSDAIEMWYGDDNAIKLIDGNVIQIIGLLEDDMNLDE